MKRILALALTLVLFTTSFAFAATQYIIPDSDTRLLDYQELLSWDYESLGFIFNEIFARHGYVFREGSKYDLYFRSRPWYKPNKNSNNTKYCYPKLNSIEWANEKLCKELRNDIRNDPRLIPYGKKNFLDYVEWEYGHVENFDYTELKVNQKLDIYSCPDKDSYRAAKGKARLSTNGAVYIAGRENGYILAMYAIDDDQYRVGYFLEKQAKDKIETYNLNFEYTSASMLKNDTLSDDPIFFNSKLMKLRAGDEVTYLTSFNSSNGMLAYIETSLDGQNIRGFVKEDNIVINK